MVVYTDHNIIMGIFTEEIRNVVLYHLQYNYKYHV